MFKSPAIFQSNATFQGLSAFENVTTFQATVRMQGNLHITPDAVLNVAGTTILRAAMIDDLQVNAAATFDSPANFASTVSFPPGASCGTMLNETNDIAIGTSSNVTITFNAVAVYLAALQAGNEVQISSLLQVLEDTVLGHNSMDQCSFHCTASSRVLLT